MKDKFRFYLKRLGERLWIRPLIMCVAAVGAALIARAADQTGLGDAAPQIELDSVKTLLTVMSGSMLVIATFSVSSMVSAYASASGSATPRAFSLVIADDVSQNALSAFIGAFIFSIVARIFVENSYYGEAGKFTLFALTLLVFAIVIVTFVGWVDSVARLGRMRSTIDKVETATAAALDRRKKRPRMGGVRVTKRPADAVPVFGVEVGYVQRVDVEALQKIAEKAAIRIEIIALPGTLTAPGRPLAFVKASRDTFTNTFEPKAIFEAFTLGKSRMFDDDPRFGLIVLSEIASRALSPGINDPGTAIDVTASILRVMSQWGEAAAVEAAPNDICELVEVPELQTDDLFDDAFRPIGRDGAGTVEVVVRLIKALESLSTIEGMREAAQRQAIIAVARAEMAMELPQDLEIVREAAHFAGVSGVRDPQKSR